MSITVRSEVVLKMAKENKKTVCRDFVRNSCSRGDTCKYFHPQKYVFCWDYQNGKCKRSDCVFIHCSRDDEEHYNQFGELPPHLLELPQVQSDLARAACNRNIKYRHPQLQQPSPPQIEVELEPVHKRRRFEPEQFIVREQQAWTIEDENVFLRNMVDCLKKKVDDLQAANEFLLEQNAQMRLNDKSGALTAVTVPAVTITNAAQLPPQALRTVTASVATVPVSLAAVAGTPVSIATVSMAPVQIPAPSVTMAQPQDQTTASQTTLLSTAGSLVSYPIVGRPIIPSLTH